jgi:hypothetical protein
MHVPMWALRVAPYVAGLSLAVAACAWAYDSGRDAERAKWQAAQQRAVEAAQAKSAAMQAQVDAAGAALSEKQQQIADMMHVQKLNTRTFYVQNPAANVACLSSDRLRHISESDAAVTAASTAR